MMFSNQPMTPQQLAMLRQRIGASEDALAGPMPTNFGSGLQQLGSAIGLAAMRARYNSQFPDAPVAQGGAAQQQPASPFQRVAEALSGNRMPWQFPDAPTAAGAPASAAPAFDSTGWNLPMTSPRQGDRQQPPVVPATPAPTPTVQPNIPVASQPTIPVASNKSGGIFGMGDILKVNTGGLW